MWKNKQTKNSTNERSLDPELLMEKKLYKNPVMEIVKIQTQQMLALSAGYNSTPISNPSDVDGREDDGDDW